MFHVINLQLNKCLQSMMLRDVVMVSYRMDLTSVYSFTIGKLVLTYVSASLCYLSSV